MIKVVPLNSKQHQQVKVGSDSPLIYAASKHLSEITVSEIGKISSSNPIFFTREPNTGKWVIIAVYSFHVGSNLLIQETQSDATYLPTSIQAYPFFLTANNGESKRYSISIDEAYIQQNNDEGERIFSDNGEPSIELNSLIKMLEGDVKNHTQTHFFTEKLEELSLFKQMDVAVEYTDDSMDTLAGLYTVDEEKMQSLSAEQLQALHNVGYLPPIYAVLNSLFQLNALIKRHNNNTSKTLIKQVKLALSKDDAVR
jgi:hypothetical protein